MCLLADQEGCCFVCGKFEDGAKVRRGVASVDQPLEEQLCSLMNIMLVSAEAVDAKNISMDEAVYHARGVRGVGRDVQVEVLLFFKKCGCQAVVSDRDCEVHEIT